MDGDDDLVRRQRGLAVAEQEILDASVQRSPRTEAMRSEAPRASSGGSASPIGEAVPRLPPIEPSARICREPSRVIMAASGASLPSSSGSSRA